MNSTYVGRFAPSPTGPLHLGSLLAAVASYLDARTNGGQWLLRIEDIDPPREIAGADRTIIDSLRHHGLHWDGDILWQSQRSDAYDAALQQLLDAGLAFYCSCSRQQLAANGGLHHGDCVAPADRNDAAIRLRVGNEVVDFVDALQGRYAQQLARDVGDVVLRRRDGLYAYQLAVVVDDAAQGVTDIVRGCDLLDSTPRQIYLQRVMGLPTPRYLHLPLLTNEQGQKLSKQNLAPALDNSRACDNLRQALSLLGQATPPAHCATPGAVLDWATQHWRRDAIPHGDAIPLPP